MAQIYETTDYIVESHEKPFVTRNDGGHIRIKVKDISITDRTVLNQRQAIELMRLTIIVGKALQKTMNEHGIPVVKINYQDMGNWAFKTGDKPFLHIHIFGRASNSQMQIWPESVYLPARESGFYEGFEPLYNEDIILIRKEIEELFCAEEYQDKNRKI